MTGHIKGGERFKALLFDVLISAGALPILLTEISLQIANVQHLLGLSNGSFPDVGTCHEQAWLFMKVPD